MAKMDKITLPDNLTEEAEKYIQTVITNLKKQGKIDSVDSGAIYMLADNYNTYIIASKTLREEGLTVTSNQGNISPHPCVKISKDSQTLCLDIMKDFGLTLKSRKSLKVVESEEEESPLTQFIKNRKR